MAIICSRIKEKWVIKQPRILKHRLAGVLTSPQPAAKVMMMAVTAAMALYDDVQRKRADTEINTSKAKIVGKGGKEAHLSSGFPFPRAAESQAPGTKAARIPKKASDVLTPDLSDVSEPGMQSMRFTQNA